MRTIENRPIPCQFCGASVPGRESSMMTPKGLLHECRWTCSRCGRLARVEEEYENETTE